MTIFYTIAFSLALTILIEGGLAAAFKSKALVRTTVLCNLLTNPLLNLALLFVSLYTDKQTVYILVMLLLETAVIIAETFLIKAMMKYPLKKACLFSIIFNGCSLLAGLIIWLTPLSAVFNLSV